MRGFPDRWTTIDEELYEIERLWPTMTPLAQVCSVEREALSGHLDQHVRQGQGLRDHPTVGRISAVMYACVAAGPLAVAPRPAPPATPLQCGT